jgi:hypothetical protein
MKFAGNGCGYCWAEKKMYQRRGFYIGAVVATIIGGVAFALV